MNARAQLSGFDFSAFSNIVSSAANAYGTVRGADASMRNARTLQAETLDRIRQNNAALVGAATPSPITAASVIGVQPQSSLSAALTNNQPMLIGLAAVVALLLVLKK